MTIATPVPSEIAVLLTVDVEEDMPRWVPERQITVANVAALPKLQRLCDAYGVRPTYLTTYAVATNPAAARTLAGVQATGRCEIGAHLHPWNTPPLPDGPRLDAVRATQIPVDAMIAKKRTLTNTLEQVFDVRPRSYRAGRFGINGLCLQALESLGYAVDSSVITGVSLADEGGEDFRSAPDRPYFPDRRDPARVGTCTVYEVPVSAGFTRRAGSRTRRLYDAIPPWTRLRGLLSDDHLGLLDHHWLYPTLVNDRALVRVADGLLERGVPVLNVFLHSSELHAGASPYSTSAADVATVFARLERLFSHLMRRSRGRGRTLGELREAQVGQRVKELV